MSNDEKPLRYCEYIRVVRDVINGRVRLIIQDDKRSVVTSTVVLFSLEEKWAETKNSMYYWNN